MSFYGCDSAPEEVRELYNKLLRCWSRETCASRMRDDWSERNPTLGQCSITSVLVQDLLGGEVLGVPLNGGGVHCFNELGGFRFDLTSEQFGGKALDYGSAIRLTREEIFADPEKLSRYKALKKRYNELFNK